MSLSVEVIRNKFQDIGHLLNERSLRVWCATEAHTIGRGGISIVHEATGVARSTIRRGLKDINSVENQPDKRPNRVRKSGGGRKRITESQPDLINDLELLIEPTTRGDPENPLRWTCKSTTKIARELDRKNHKICQRTVYNLLDKLGYSLQSNKKNKEGSSHPDRNAQFEYISNKTRQFQKNSLPVISVDSKKKELIGLFKNSGKEYSKKGQPVEVNVYDFPDKNLGKVAPYGVYDITHNKGWVSVGISHDTAEFAVATIRSWWQEMGKPLYPNASEILITADGGGSNGSRVRLWKTELQKLSNELNMIINVCHFPPGTSKWNKIEHKMFSFITINWRGRPLIDRVTVVELIGNTTTNTGLEIKAMLDERQYEKGKKVKDQDLDVVNIQKADFHGEWNYKISPAK